MRSGTSIGANVMEASAGQPKKDFVAKMSIASKEARETLYWLKVFKESRLSALNFSEYILLNEDLVRILTAIVKTSQARIAT